MMMMMMITMMRARPLPAKFAFRTALDSLKLCGILAALGRYPDDSRPNVDRLSSDLHDDAPVARRTAPTFPVFLMPGDWMNRPATGLFVTEALRQRTFNDTFTPMSTIRRWLQSQKNA
ncbi:hypothetical protein DPMN_038724 [Dreissena polymorpha]|uniref:Uncharacterized protein n=1 Tax=Dreissena polymorpha TaxID=45954 RepID=A0A9D4RQK5_DREPO|nr:hypothetical protein DPMN_038724 [Dreissena polymorpha]